MDLINRDSVLHIMKSQKEAIEQEFGVDWHYKQIQLDVVENLLDDLEGLEIIRKEQKQ